MLRVGGGASNCQSVHFRHTGWWLDRSTVVDTTRIHFRQSAVQQRAVSCIAAAVKTGPPDLELRGITLPLLPPRPRPRPRPRPSPSSPAIPAGRGARAMAGPRIRRRGGAEAEADPEAGGETWARNRRRPRGGGSGGGGGGWSAPASVPPVLLPLLLILLLGGGGMLLTLLLGGARRRRRRWGEGGTDRVLLLCLCLLCLCLLPGRFLDRHCGRPRPTSPRPWSTGWPRCGP